jgi:hypothetical protein
LSCEICLAHNPDDDPEHKCHRREPKHIAGTVSFLATIMGLFLYNIVVLLPVQPNRTLRALTKDCTNGMAGLGEPVQGWLSAPAAQGDRPYARGLRQWFETICP